MTDIRTFFNNTKFDVRACGILRHNNKVLVSYESDGSVTLNGGAVSIGESTEQAVVREFFEETNLYVQVDSLVAVIENFFTLNSHSYQQIVFVYDLSLIDSKEQELKCKEKLSVRWEKIESINNLKPVILNKVIKSKNKEIQHYINRD